MDPRQKSIDEKCCVANERQNAASPASRIQRRIHDALTSRSNNRLNEKWSQKQTTHRSMFNVGNRRFALRASSVFTIQAKTKNTWLEVGRLQDLKYVKK